VYSFEEIEIDCVIKVISLTGNVVFGRILDPQSVMLFFSRCTPTEDKEEDYDVEVLVEHLIREVSEEELKMLLELVEMSVRDFFSVDAPTERRFLN
jgi:hypothetical protein